MKKKDFLPQEYRELTGEESFECNGGGFAYDVGRLIRFICNSGHNGANVGLAIGDFIVNRYEL